MRTGAGGLACALLGSALLLSAPASAQEAGGPEGASQERARLESGGLESGGGFGGDRALRVADETFDVLCLRTSGFVTTLIGAAAFVPAVMMTAPGGLEPIREAFDHFVLTPGRYTFTRPLGEF
jgi:hypothetical protein